MEIKGAVAVVTGANRGIGLTFTRALLDRGAAKVYAGVRNPDAEVREPGVRTLHLDVTDSAQITAAAATASDATIVINNAGIQAGPGLLEGSLEGARRELEVNYLGTWAVSRAFAPVLASNGGGALVNRLSVASWRVNNRWPSYAASKAAEWSLTNARRAGLRRQGTLVVGVHVGPVDTEATAGADVPKVAAAEVAAQTMDAIGRGGPEVLVDEVSHRVRAALSGPVELLEPAP
ncbi:SDR family NAD(P)-dependent oxidoreductase [Streptomyces broussonetiae]|uniref:SDR family NAD(P)-dependent oxidoreductase n=1 Tax=Streptomyces broussonetiae TaxID=2686304 RepID=A0A6I6N6S3_9ACTN|nr:SDR family oxidoreductase [Streptomyces broussonetiae]QHA08898.1 SDR family NAD(P)-dependent oxidoreductase [Streptomyces broussonetiae]